MISLVWLAIAGSQKMLSKVTPADVVGIWQSHFYSDDPPFLLDIKADGTFVSPNYRGTWRIVENKLMMRPDREPSSEGRLYVYSDGDRLSDNVPDGDTYFRYSTVMVEENLLGLWSTTPNPKAGHPGDQTIIISGQDSYRWGTKKGQIKISRGHAMFEHPAGKWSELWPNTDYSQFSGKDKGGLSLYRLPEGSGENAILGRWLCRSVRSDAKLQPLVFRKDHTYLYKGKVAKWTLGKSALELKNLGGATVKFDLPTHHGTLMRSSKLGYFLWR